MSAPLPVLFVAHEGTLTGAPMVLLHLVRWLRDNSRVEPTVAVLRDGPLTEQFAEVGPTTVLGTEVDWPSATDLERRLVAAGRRRIAARAEVARLRRTVAPIAGSRRVYLNSAASLRLLHHLPRASASVLHVHELSAALGWSVRPQDRLLVRSLDHVVAAADCVAANAIHQLGIRADRVTRVYEFIDPDRVRAPGERDRDEIRAELGLPAAATIVGGSGWGDWRKGIDLFTQLARSVVRSGRGDVHFVWVGGLPGGEDGEQVAFDVERSGAADHIHHVGLQSRPADWYRAFDVFALTSREDPYPLVGLETSALGVPMVCFEGAGGMVELIRRSTDEGRGESGVIVPYLDVEAMADAVLDLLDDPERRAQAGALASSIVERDHRVDVAGPQVLEVIERVLGGGAT